MDFLEVVLALAEEMQMEKVYAMVLEKVLV